ncbi:MAG: DUF2162 domain-containing protein [Deltaproteobacteria bacterium]|jgi:predicted transporter|nr:DUF2162 domain-containing protein [Deltaproteobacteria bacterium]
MELKTLWLGALISMGAFAVKTGLGCSYLCSGAAGRRKALIAASTLVAYGALFAAVYQAVSRVDLFSRYETLAPLWRNGRLLHWLAAAVMFLWGALLFKKGSSPMDSSNNPGKAGSRAWLLLLIPCPVCLSAILLTIAGLAAFFPEKAASVTAGIFACFALMALAAALLQRLGRRLRTSGTPENALGKVMILMAVYFAVSALIIPRFSDISRIYGLAVHSAEDGLRSGPAHPGVLIIVCLLLMIASFAWRRRRLSK